MPLTELQREVARVIRAFRASDNFVAGGAVLNRDWPRLSDDLDIFLDQRRRLPDCVEPELDALRKAGFSIEVAVRNDLIVEAIVGKAGSETRIQWFDDPETCLRFFPAVVDDDLGYRLHPADVAVNKVLCASRRREPRDAVDLIYITMHYAALGPLINALQDKEPDASPPELARRIRANAFSHSDVEIAAVRMENGPSISRQQLRHILDEALDAAVRYCLDIAPMDYGGYLFVDENDVPTEAEDDMIESGAARAIQITDFGRTVIIGGDDLRS